MSERLRSSLPFFLFLVLGLLSSVQQPAAQTVPRIERSGSTYHVRLCQQDQRPNFASCHAHVVTDDKGQPRWHRNREFFLPNATKPMALPSGYGPVDLRSAYKVTASGSSSMTIAIVDAYGYPNAEADLAVYRNMYGLPPCTTANGCFQKVNQSGGTSYPAYDAGWAGEQALDLDMVSAICPNCKILLVQANSSYNSDLAKAVQRAALMGAHAISNSYGAVESSGSLSSYGGSYNIPGVAVTASSGDSGYRVEMPAAYPGVVAVGGTRLSRSSGSARGWSEVAWSGAGSGCSAYASKPSWQKDSACARRMVADVSAVADPQTGVAVYGPVSGGSGWLVYGGTSASAPIIAALYGINAGNVTAGQNPYLHTSSLFDITSGSNGSCTTPYFCKSVAGYDGPTGLGTPNGVQAFGELPSTNVQLSYTAAGTGSGTVSFSPQGSAGSCNGTCSSAFATGALVTLTPAADAGSAFAGWSGNAACSGTDPCQLTMSAAQSVTATFNASATPAALSNGVTLTNLAGAVNSKAYFTIEVPAAATDLSIAISGGSGDSDLYVQFGSQPTLSVYGCRPYASGNNETCSFATPSAGTYYVMLNGYTAYSSLSLVASYTDNSTYYALNYTAAGSGGGTVSFTPAGTTASCSSNCTNSYLSGKQVTLTATPAAGSVFTGWSGNDACTGTGTCQISMAAEQSVTATFDVSGTVTMLSNGVAVTGLAAAQGTSALYAIDVPDGATNLSVVTTGGTGNADLYVAFGSQPTVSTHDCSSANADNGESCSIPTPSGGTYYITLAGTAAYGGVSLTASYSPPPAPDISVSPASLAFASRTIDTTSDPLTVTVGNSGTADLTVSSVSVTGTDAAAFAAVNGCTTVAPQDSCTISVTFTPASAGAKSAGLAIASNDAATPGVQVSLSGTGLPPGPIVAQFAGTIDGPGFANGTGSDARFNAPTGIAVDSSNTLYVTDSNNNLIRKITSGGVVSTLAGRTLTPGSTNSSGTSALFNLPTGLTINGSTMVVADTNNQLIRKLSTSGTASALAGSSGSAGSANGTGTAARFRFPRGVVFDSSGNVFVSDTGNATIRKVTSAGAVSTFAGSPGAIGGTNGTGTAARFASPGALARGGSNTLFVPDVIGQTVRRVTSSAVVSTFAGAYGVAGSTDNTSGTAARFSAPSGAVVDGSGNIFIADAANGTIRKITGTGSVSTFAGTAGVFGSADDTGPAASFYRPTGIARDASNNLYVADPVANVIRKITSSAQVTTIAGYSAKVGAADDLGSLAGFSSPAGIAADSSGNLFVADTANHTIRMVTPDGQVTTFAGTAGQAGATNGSGSSARFSSPAGLAVDASGNVYVADTGNNLIRKITSAGDVSTLAGSTTAGSADGTGTAARFRAPAAVALGPSGLLYVADTGNYTIRKIVLSTAQVTTLAGTAGSTGTANGTGTAARFGLVYGIGVDGSGNIFAADYSGSTIRRITSGGAVTTFAGTANTRGTTNATGTSARFSSPYGLTVDADNNIYVGDYGNCLVRKVTSAAVVTTPVGTPGTCKFIPGSGPASINTPLGVAKSGATLYFTAGNGIASVTNIP